MKKYLSFFSTNTVILSIVTDPLFSVSTNAGNSQPKPNFLTSKNIGKAILLLVMIMIGFGVVILLQGTHYGYIFVLLLSTFVYWVGFVGIHRNKPDSITEEIKIETPIEKAGYSTFSRIDNYIVSEKKYLVQDLSLKSIAEEFEISKGYISQLVNIHAQKNFNDYINELRIEEAKKMLADDTYDNYTIEFVGIECGFRSKSSFYGAFKKFSGCTPNQFKKRA